MGQDTEVLLYGATGYTGRLICQELEHRGLSYAIAGRDATRLQKLSSALPSKPPALAVPLSDHDGLVRICGWSDVVIGAAGPFIELGPPLMRAAIAAGVPFLDITGEQAYLRWAHEQDEAARDAGTTIVNAMGFDVVPSDIAAHLAAAGLETTDTLELGIATNAKVSGGTRRSMAAGAGKAWYWHDGAYKTAPPGRFLRTFDFPGTLGTRTTVFIPWGDCVTAPRTTGAHTVKTYFSTKPKTAKRIHRAWPLTALATRTPLARNRIARRADPMGEGPDEAHRRASRFTIVAEATGTDRKGETATHTATVEGRDPYGLTAAAVAHGAHLLVHQGAPPGVQTPTQAFPVVSMANALKRFDFQWRGPHDPPS